MSQTIALRRFSFASASLLAAVAAAPASAVVWRVGPGELTTRIADVAKVAGDGDVVEILPGEYRGDVAVWSQKSLTLRGVGERPVLVADGQVAEGKAIWVIRDGEFTIDNLAFRGARAPDGNGAGIRFERGRLTVRNSAFIDNQNGILAGHDANAELKIEDSYFADAPRQTEPPPHLIYVGRIKRVEISGSRFENGHEAHLVKSRARVSDLRYNLMVDGGQGRAGYEVDLPNGGVAFLVGNVIGQSARTTNPVVVSYGVEGAVWPENRLVLVHNTLLSERLAGAWFLRAPGGNFPAPPKIEAVNNLTVGFGVFSLGASGDFAGNFHSFSGLLGDPAALDFSLAADSWLRDAGQPLDGLRDDAGRPLAPTAEFSPPLGKRPLPAPARWTPGAVQTPTARQDRR